MLIVLQAVVKRECLSHVFTFLFGDTIAFTNLHFLMTVFINAKHQM